MCNIAGVLFCSACYKDPEYPDDYIFEAKLLPNVRMPERTLRPQGVLGPYRPQIGFSQRDSPCRSYSTPAPAQRMIRLGFMQLLPVRVKHGDIHCGC